MPVSEVHLSLARWYSTEGDALHATAAYESALAAAGDDRAALNVRMLMAWEALREWNLDRAAALLGEAEPGCH
jgi:hypothetical protein